jgi:hypothetical protein
VKEVLTGLKRLRQTHKDNYYRVLVEPAKKASPLSFQQRFGKKPSKAFLH